MTEKAKKNSQESRESPNTLRTALRQQLARIARAMDVGGFAGDTADFDPISYGYDLVSDGHAYRVQESRVQTTSVYMLPEPGDGKIIVISWFEADMPSVERHVLARSVITPDRGILWKLSAYDTEMQEHELVVTRLVVGNVESIFENARQKEQGLEIGLKPDDVISIISMHGTSVDQAGIDDVAQIVQDDRIITLSGILSRENQTVS